MYSIGVVLYEMLAGRTPFNGDSPVALAMAHATQPPPPLPATIPEPLGKIVMRALAKNPEHRYSDGHAMARALTRARPRPGGDDAVPKPARGARVESSTTVLFDGAAQRSRSTAPGAAPALATPRAAAQPTATATSPGTAVLDPDVRSSPEPSMQTAATRPRARTRGQQTQPTPSPATAPRRREHSQERVDATRVAPHETLLLDRKSPRRPARLAIVLLALGLLALAALAIRTITAPSIVRVPDLHGFTAGRVERLARRADLDAVLIRRYASAPAGVAFSQHPAPGARVDSGSNVAVFISRGAPPVPVPELTGQSVSAAEQYLRSIHLDSTVSTSRLRVGRRVP